MLKQILGEWAVPKSPSAEGLIISGLRAGAAAPGKPLAPYAGRAFRLSLIAQSGADARSRPPGPGK